MNRSVAENVNVSRLHHIESNGTTVADQVVADAEDSTPRLAVNTNNCSSVDALQDSHPTRKHPPPLINSEDAYCRQESDLDPNHLSLETTSKLCHVGVPPPPMLIPVPVSFSLAGESSNSTSYVNPKTEPVGSEVEPTVRTLWHRTGFYHIQPPGGPEGSGVLPVGMQGFQQLSPISPTPMTGVPG